MLISRTSRLAFLTLLATTALAGPAWATSERYASPMGSGNACTAASPCDLQTAITLSNDGDDVAVTPGDYGLTQFYVPPSAITIHGIAGQARPRLLLIGSLQSGWGLPNGTTLRDLEIDQTYPGKATLTTWYAILDRVIIRGAPGADCAVSIFEGNITNSIVVSPGTAICSGASSSSNTSTYRNVTAISTDPGSVAIDVNADGANAFATVLLSNVIAKGGQNGAGFITSTDSSGAHATTSASHTNYANSLTSGTNAVTVDAGGNQGTSPKFVDPAQGDYHEAAGSVTIDAGVDHPGNGPSDLDGDARTIGTTDIGADEFVPPPPPASPPSPPSNAGSGTPSPSPAPADPPSSTSTPPSSTPTPPKARFVGVRLLSTRLSLRHRRITLSLQCPAGTVGRCAGSTLLSARRTTLGRARFSIPAGHRLTVTVRITRAGRGLFASRRRLQAQDSNAARNGVGQSKTTVARVTIRRAR